MLTNNAKKLLMSTIKVYPSGSAYRGVYESVDEPFVLHTNHSTDGILNSSEAAEETAKQRCVCTLGVAFYGYRGFAPYFRIFKKSNLPTDNSPASTHVFTVCTYDPEDSPITADAVNVPGNDLSDALQTVSASVQNNYTVTITFNNASDSVMHVNRLGFYMGVQAYPISTANGCMLMHIFAFDDIALEPGQTKSITIQTDLD